MISCDTCRTGCTQKEGGHLSLSQVVNFVLNGIFVMVKLRHIKQIKENIPGGTTNNRQQVTRQQQQQQFRNRFRSQGPTPSRSNEQLRACACPAFTFHLLRDNCLIYWWMSYTRISQWIVYQSIYSINSSFRPLAPTNYKPKLCGSTSRGWLAQRVRCARTHIHTYIHTYSCSCENTFSIVYILLTKSAANCLL